MDSKIYPQVIRDTQERVYKLERQFLEQEGWEYSSDNPFHSWLYCKTINGTQYCVCQSTAVGLAARRFSA